MWKNFINHAKKEEDTFWEIDDIVDEVSDSGDIKFENDDYRRHIIRFRIRVRLK